MSRKKENIKNIDNKQNASGKAIVICDSLNVREKPTVNSNVLVIIDKHTHLNVIETATEFSKIQIINNNAIPYGYVMNKFIKYE